jgi:hypothetical protein
LEIQIEGSEIKRLSSRYAFFRVHRPLTPTLLRRSSLYACA